MHRFAFFCAAAGAFFLFTMYDSYEAFAAALSIILAPIPVALSAYLCSRRTKVRTVIPSSAERGGTISVSAELKMPARFLFPNPEITIGGIRPSSVEHRKNTSVYVFHIHAYHCGILPVEPVSVRFSDAFGLFRFNCPSSPTGSVVILPRLIGSYHAVMHVLTRFLAEADREYSGNSPYRTGDDRRFINWKMTARKDEFYVRDFTASAGSGVVLLSDLPRDPDQRDTSADTLFTLGSALLASGRDFSFSWAEKDGRSFCSVIHSESSFRSALCDFLTHSVDSGACKLCNPLFPPDSRIMYITGTPSCTEGNQHSIIWAADSHAQNADFAGHEVIVRALGGDTDE